jgi:hypothetical protein
MYSRRFFLRLAATGLIAATTGATLSKAQEGMELVYLPLILTPPEPTPTVITEVTETPEVAETPHPSPTATATATTTPATDDAPLLGPASGRTDQAISWLVARSNSYTAYDIGQVVARYQALGDSVGLDWFLALAQCAHETGSLTSWWCQRPRRNPAGIGVTGRIVPGTPDSPPGPDWSWDGIQWREGISFATWADHGIPAHLGRLLAYALRDEQATNPQRELISYALSFRPLPSNLRGIAPTIVGLNGRWAYPGTTYGQSIVDLARRIRG